MHFVFGAERGDLRLCRPQSVGLQMAGEGKDAHVWMTERGVELLLGRLAFGQLGFEIKKEVRRARCVLRQ